MKLKYKVLIIAEVAVLFSPSVIGLWACMMLCNFGIDYFALNIAATFGLFGVLGLLLKVVMPERKNFHSRLSTVMVMSGLCTIAYINIIESREFEWNVFHLVSLMAIIGTIHLVYLCRDYLFFQKV